ncbi:hypothetical protein RSAG8_07362, partial [Rhizoctonia solani AG-8 WAC10335]
MLQRFFRPTERAFISERHEEWKEVQGMGKEIVDGDVVCPKSQLVSRVVTELLRRFPERDHTRNPQGSLAWGQGDRDSLWERTRQLFYNLDHAMVVKSQEDGKFGMKTTHAPSFLTLFKRHYSSEIIALKESYLKEGRYTEGMTAYNAAVRYILEQKRQSELEVVDQLEALAVQVKSNLQATPEEQPEEVRQAVLEVLPAEIIRTVRGWEKRTGARIYVMGIWKNSKNGHTKFDYASKRCGNYLKSTLGKQIFEDWIKYMVRIEGDVNKETIEPKAAVYPNAEGWPTFPRTDILKLHQDDERMLLQRYFALTSIASGGVTPSWTWIQRDGNTTTFVRPEQLPDNMPQLGNIKDWCRQEMQLMSKHLIDGQLDGDTLFTVDQQLNKPVPNLNLPWTAAELAYGKWMLSTHIPESSSPNAQVMILPPAHTTHVYAPFNLMVFEELEDLHGVDTVFFQLITNVATVEKLGPIHCAMGLVESCGHPNPHLPPDSGLNIVESDDINRWLPNDFFMTNTPSPWSLSNFLTWLNDHHAYMHEPTGTVYMGPLGIRNVVFALARMKRILDWTAANIDVPTRIKWIMKGSQSTFNLAKAYLVWRECVQLVSNAVLHTQTILAASFEERAAEFEQDVLNRAGRPDAHQDKDTGIQATSGVPKSGITLAAMAAMIRHAREECDEEAQDNEASMIAADRTIAMEDDGLEEFPAESHTRGEAADNEPESEPVIPLRPPSVARPIATGPHMEHDKVQQKHRSRTLQLRQPGSNDPVQVIGNEARDTDRNEVNPIAASHFDNSSSVASPSYQTIGVASTHGQKDAPMATPFMHAEMVDNVPGIGGSLSHQMMAAVSAHDQSDYREPIPFITTEIPDNATDLVARPSNQQSDAGPVQYEDTRTAIVCICVNDMAHLLIHPFVPMEVSDDVPDLPDKMVSRKERAGWEGTRKSGRIAGKASENPSGQSGQSSRRGSGRK